MGKKEGGHLEDLGLKISTGLLPFLFSGNGDAKGWVL